MINKCILVGRITKDPEVKYTTNNLAVSTFSLAIDRPFTDNSGEKVADFIQCVAWRKQAENMGKYVKKGALLGVEGRIQTRSYETDGEKRYITEVVCDSVQFLGSASPRNDEERTYQNQESSKKDNDSLYQSSRKFSASEDDLPF